MVILIDEHMEHRKLSEHADYMTIKEFIDCCEYNDFVDDDGDAYYATENRMVSKKSVLPSDILKGLIDTNFTHIAWFNK